MYKLGRKYDDMAVASSPEKGKVWYPSVSLTSSDDIPEFNKKIGSKITFKGIGTLKSIRKEDDGYCYEIELKGCEPMASISDEDYDNLSDEEKDKKDKESVEEKSIDDTEE